MTDTTATEYPFQPLPASEAVERYRAVSRDRPMSKVVLPHGGEVWMVYRSQTARAVLTDSRFSRRPFTTGEREVPFRVKFPEFFFETMMFTDQPDHTKLRRLVARAISPRAVKEMRASAVAHANLLIDRLLERGGPADLQHHYALSLPIEMLSNLLGVPVEDREDFEKWAFSMLAVSGIDASTKTRYMQELRAYFVDLIRLRREDPRDDLISSLAMARERDESLTDDEILPIAMILLVGGFDNTANTICIGVQALLNNDEQRELFLSDIDGLAPTAVEEILRHGKFAIGGEVLGMGNSVPCVAMEDVTVDGQLIRAGDAVMVDNAAVNHDDATFDHPERFDITRTDNPHFGLSYGIHNCIGAPLARLEVQVGISELFRRIPNLRVAGEMAEDPTQIGQSITQFPVTW